jgi:signal transduction histidine kinase
MKLFPKLALVVSGLVVGSILTVSVWMYSHEKRDVEEHARQEQQAVLQNLVNMAEEAIVAYDDLMLVKYIQLLQQWNPSLTSASVVGPHGEILAHSEISRIGRQATAEPLGPSYGLLLSQSVNLKHHRLGNASVTFSQRRVQEALDAQIAQIKKRMASITGLILLLGFGLSFWIAHSWTRPIGKLAGAFEQIGKGQWGVNLGTLEHRKDEIGFLSRSCLAMATQLAELDQLKDDFVAAVSHEFRSPLAAIESYLDRIEVVRKRGDPPERWVGNLEPIRASAERLERFVDDLLDVAYAHTGKLSLERRTTDLSLLARDTLNHFDIKFREKHITYDLAAPQAIPIAYVDPDRIRQVLTNLLSNALKFTPEGGHVQMGLEAVNQGRSVRVMVKDNGIGIAQADQTRVFNKFEQVKSARAKVKTAKGSGLGLAISRALVELHGGAIGVTSELGRGSEFFFTLPVVPAAIPIPIS